MASPHSPVFWYLLILSFIMADPSGSGTDDVPFGAKAVSGSVYPGGPPLLMLTHPLVPVSQIIKNAIF